jgi:hypothetical protein
VDSLRYLNLCVCPKIISSMSRKNISMHWRKVFEVFWKECGSLRRSSLYTWRGVLERVPPLKTEEVTHLKADRTLKLKCLERLFDSFLLEVKEE